MSVSRKALFIVFTVIILDQILKIWVKTHMYIGQEYRISGNWFIIHFIENNGMAFGLNIPGEFGKIALSLFRILAISVIGWYLFKLTKEKVSFIVITSISLIFAGALGNMIDSAFYGIIFNDSYYHVAEFLPEKGGYSGFLHGRVVDMFYFPIIRGHYPDWFPFRGSQQFLFFRPVFNIADSSITIGVSLFIIFQKRFMKL